MKEGPEMLSDASDSGSEDDFNQLTINEHFAKAYEAKKEREELANCAYAPLLKLQYL